MKVANVYTEMLLNIDEGSLKIFKSKIENLGTEVGNLICGPIEKAFNDLNLSPLDVITKNLKIIPSLLEGIPSIFGSVMKFLENNTVIGNIKKGIGWISSGFEKIIGWFDKGKELALTFKEMKNLKISAHISGISINEIGSSFTEFKEKLKKAKEGVNDESSKVLRNTLGDSIDKESEIELYNRFIASNKGLDKKTATKNVNTVFKNTTSKHKKYLMGEGADSLTTANQIVNAEELPKENEYKKDVQDVNVLDVNKNLTISLNSSEMNEEIKKLANKVDDLLGNTINNSSDIIKAVNSTTEAIYSVSKNINSNFTNR